MSLRHLESLLRPKSVTLVGASNRPKSIGSVVMNNLLQGNFVGPILPVNPKYTSVYGILAYASIEELPLSPDLAIVCTPPETVPDFVEKLGQKNVKSVLIMSTDLDKYTDSSNRDLRQAVMDIARQYNMRILGPNCLGVIIPRSGLNASFGHTNIPEGQIAFVSQSDSLGIGVLDWAYSKGIGFSYFISLGDCADIDFADIIDYLAGDPYTTSILLYIEHIQNARKFISAARSASRNKPLAVIKSGLLDEGLSQIDPAARMTVSTDDIYDGLFRRAGMLRVSDVAELFDAVETLARSKPLRGDKLAILSNGGGPAIMARDLLLNQGGRLAELSDKTLQELQDSLKGDYFGTNPIRLIDHAPSDYYSEALDILLKDQGVNAVMVIHVPTAFASSSDIAGTIVNTLGQSWKNIFTVWLGEKDAAQARRMFAMAGVPTYETPDQAVQLYMDLVRYRRNQELLMETPHSVPQEFTPDPEAAKAMVKNALQEGRNLLSPSETIEILATYAIPVVETRIAEDEEEATLLARELGYPVALKIFSPDIRHKPEVGAVVLDLENEEDLKKAAQGMLTRVENLSPQARVEGFIIQKMARRPGSHELLTGVTTDPDFGPVIVFGQGGRAGQIIKDSAVGLPPLNLTLAKEVMQRTRINRLLEGERGKPGADVESVKLTLVQLSQLIIDIPEIVWIRINPLLADPSGVLVLDAQIEVASAELSGEARLSIRPYPERLEECAVLKSGLRVLLRPIRPEDEPSHREFIYKLDPEDVRMRFFSFVHEFPHTQLAMLTQIDYDREMAFIAKRLEEDQEKETLGVVRTYFDPDNTSSEFAIVIDSELKSYGLGSQLMDKMIRYCRERKTTEMTAYVLKENRSMQLLARKFGFQMKSLADDPEVIELKMKLE